jgi:hypothetical protein
VLSFLYPIVAGVIGVGYVFIFYAIATFISFFYFRKYLVETKGKTLEELEKDMLK